MPDNCDEMIAQELVAAIKNYRASLGALNKIAEECAAYGGPHRIAAFRKKNATILQETISLIKWIDDQLIKIPAQSIYFGKIKETRNELLESQLLQMQLSFSLKRNYAR